MGKSSRNQAGKMDITRYRMSIHFGVSMELDSVNAIYVDEKEIWRGEADSVSTLTIDIPDLFGGDKKEGGVAGKVSIFPGRATQKLNTAAASRYKLTPDTCPAFRGITTLMFHGAELDGGFLWKTNSPVIAQSVWVEGTRSSKGLNPTYAMIGPDSNPVHMIYECLVNTEWGMSGSIELIDTDQFEAEAVRIFDEEFGLSMMWMRQTDIQSFITEILDHIQATLFVNPNTGLLSIKLLRDDYDLETLREITPDNATLSNFKRRSSGEIVNEITVTWTNPETELEETVTVQDNASIASQDGQSVAGSRDYHGIRNLKLATEVLAREIRSSTAPLVSADAKLDRTAWDVLPGEVMLLSWPDRGAYSVVVRAGKVNYGKPLDSAIRVSLMQDIFSLARPPIKIKPPTDWVDPAVEPSPLEMQIFTVPSYFVRNAAIQKNAVDLTPPEVLAGVLADSVSIDTLDYELVSGTIMADGSTVVTSKGSMSLTPLGYLSTTLPDAATSTLPFALFPVADETPEVGGFVFIGYGDTDQEICLVTGVSDTGWTIARGVLDTSPRTWTLGTPVWAVNPGARIVDSQTLHSDGEEVTYRGLDRTALGLLPYTDAPVVEATMTARPHLPLRPANVKVNGASFSDVAAGANIVITWSIRNRLLEDTQVLLWTDGPVTPEYRQETVIRFYDYLDNLIIEYDGFWDQNTYTFPASYFNRYATVTVEVASRRDDYDSINNHRVIVTGLPGDIGAPGPGPGTDPVDPPSNYDGPGLGVYTIVGGEITNGAGNIIPAIVVQGKPDNLRAESLLIRYQLYPDGDFWYRSGPSPLNGRFRVHAWTENVLPDEEYEIEVAYLFTDPDIGSIESRWTPVGRTVTANRFPDGTKITRIYDTFADLPASPPAEDGDTAWVLDEQKLYTYRTGEGWSKEIDGEDIAAETIQTAAIAQSIRPPQRVGVLPAVDNYLDRAVFLETDHKLYLWTSDSVTTGTDHWHTPGVDAETVTGQLTDEQIADLDAAKISGQLTNTQIADIAATKITGQLTDDQIADLDATKITGQLTNAQLADIAATKITGQLTNTQIADVAAAKLTGTIVETQIGTNAITTAKIAAGAITTAKIAADAVTANEIAAATITATEIASGAIITAKIAAGAVTANEIATNAITAVKISAGAITTAKIAAGAVTANEIAAATITATEIASGAIITAKIAAGAVTADEIATNAITAVKISAGAITTAKIAANAVTANEIAAATITATEIATNAITTAKIAAGAVTANEIAANTITAAKIAAFAIGASEIAAGAVIASKVAITGENKILDTEFADTGASGYWYPSGAGMTPRYYDGATNSFVAGMGATRALAFQATDIGAATDCGVYGGAFDVEPSTVYTANLVRRITTSGFTGFALMYVRQVGVDGAVLANTIIDNAGDYRVSGSAPTALTPVTAQFTTHASAVRAYIWFRCIWSTTRPNAAGVYWARPWLKAAATGLLIVDGAIETAKLAALAITSDKIAAGAITAAKINVTDLSAISANLGTISVTAANIANLTVTGAKIANLTITGAKIADAAISTAKIGTAAITTAKIGNLQVDTLQIAGQAVNVIETSRITVSKNLHGGAEELLDDLVIVVATGEAIQILASAAIVESSNGDRITMVRLYRGATLIYEAEATHSGTDTGAKASAVATVVWVDKPSAGTYTYSYKAQRTTSGGTCTAGQRLISISRVKR